MLPLFAGSSDRVLTSELEVNAPLEKRPHGPTAGRIGTFLAPYSKVDPRVDGACEIYFFPNARKVISGLATIQTQGFETPYVGGSSPAMRVARLYTGPRF